MWSFCHENKFLVCVNIPGNKAHSDFDKLIHIKNYCAYSTVSVFPHVFCVISVRSGSDVSSSVSVKSDQSRDEPLNFREKTPSSAKRYFMDFCFRKYVSECVMRMTRRETCGSKCKLFIKKHGQYRQGRALANRYGMGKTQE